VKNSHSRRRIVSTLALTISSVILSACTFVPTDGQPQPVNSKTVPFNLLVKHPGLKAR
jgi:hypothetical protein